MRKGSNAIPPWIDRHGDRKETEIFGDAFLDATARGEIPSLLDVTSADEAVALIAIAKHPVQAAACLIVLLNIFKSPVAEAAERELLDRIPDVAYQVLFLAALDIAQGHWHRARHRAREAIQRISISVDPEGPQWSPLVTFFATCVQHGRAAEAAELVAELDLHDRWLPLNEALQIAGGTPDRLSRLAPEVKAATIELLELLQRPDPLAFLRSADPPPTPKKPRRRRSPR